MWPPVPRSIIRGMKRSQPCTSAHDVDRDQPVPVLGRGVKESGPDTDSGVVDQQIDGVEPGVDRVGEFVHRIGVGDVDGLGEHLGAQSAGCFGGLFQSGLVQIADGKTCTAARAQQGSGSADAAAGAGDEHDAILQVLDASLMAPIGGGGSGWPRRGRRQLAT